ncbi:alanine dehydrogenase [Marinagarivorans cellulosilyticus]|uniref:Alanine dehydrogenase n=1 Tax=Marinagarivorans cellulosilyticus TaxID=2721545 RepID=A0AAN2BLU1_9GAMM|nr:alanine dehydrogenase [Marinagarivorans cellulosilyticus]BCD99483.1 alanine dehydrogenase [Marinagarivorans cellulosilyticus]
MRIGIPSEVKNHEYRVGMLPAGASVCIAAGHEVWVQSGAGLAVGCDDAAYTSVGVHIEPSAETLYGQCDLIVKVKEPQAKECEWLRRGQLLFGYLHLAADSKLTAALCDRGVTAIAYETITDRHGRLPLLQPMSEVAGRLAIQAAAMALTKPVGGKGVLMAGVPGTAPANVVVLGGGVVGANAVEMALGLGAQVTVLDTSVERLRELAALFGPRLQTRVANKQTLLGLLPRADVVVGAVLIPGAAAPKLLGYDDLKKMQPGTVLVDVAIDQGGCFESSHATTHEHPTYIREGIVHYCVANMPGAVPLTSTHALTNVTLPYILRLANEGLPAARNDALFAKGINVHDGQIVNDVVAKALAL